MKKEFETPNIEIIRFKSMDVILTASNDDLDDDWSPDII